MTRVLFVHGTMTRYTEEYLRTFRLIERRLRGWRGRTVVEKFPWGEFWGAELNPRFLAIPGADERAADVLGGGSEDDALSEAARWALLYDDPTAELRLLLEPAAAGAYEPQTVTSQQLRRAARQIADTPPAPPLAALLAEADIAETFPAAAIKIAGLFQQGELQPLLRVIPDDQREAVRPALARAIVAAAMVAARTDSVYPEAFLDAGLRERVVAAVDESLIGGAVLGGTGELLAFLPATALTRLLLRPLRVDLTRALLQFLGDILVYQAKGARLRAELAAQLGPEPTVLLAHSLGGIACVELLLSDAAVRRAVPLLITVGSQAGMLHELGALATAPRPDGEPTPLPADFPPWLNICDRNDLLSFRAAPLFAGRVRDVELDGLTPFPDAHNAYWRSDAVWAQIISAVAAPGDVNVQLRE